MTEGVSNSPPTEKGLSPSAKYTLHDVDVTSGRPASSAINHTVSKVAKAESRLRHPFKSPLKRDLSIQLKDQEDDTVQCNSKRLKQEHDRHAMTLPGITMAGNSACKSMSLDAQPSPLAATPRASSTLSAATSGRTTATMPPTKAYHQHSRTHLPFRSPLIQTGRGHIPTKHDPSTADKKAEIRTLQYRVAELKSSVRNAKLAKKYQESEAGSLDALIGKWKRASQEAAQYLVEQMVDYDNGNDYYTSSWTTSTVPVNHGEAQGGWWWHGQQVQHQREHPCLIGSSGGASETFGSIASALARDNSDDSQTSSLPVLDKEPKKAAVAAESSNSGVEEEVTRQRSRYSQAKFRAKLDMVCERIDYQDTVEDLPTVEEAIRCHEYVGEDDERGYSPKKLPKMQRLLLGLKIDPNLLGYNAVLDEFTEGTRHG